MAVKLNTENREYITWQYERLNFGLLGGLKIEGLERMRVTLKVEYKQIAVRHNLDLYNNESLDKMIRRCAERFTLGTAYLAGAFAGLINDLEVYRLDQMKALVKEKEPVKQLTEAESVYGKITEIQRTATSANPVSNIQYTYDAAVNRISKRIAKSSGSIEYTWYVRDAQGNVMSTYAWLQPGRQYGTKGRYLFNGKEQDPEVKGEGAHLWQYAKTVAASELDDTDPSGFDKIDFTESYSDRRCD